MKTHTLMALLMSGCGGAGAMTGDTTVRFEWHGSWSADERLEVVSFVEGLQPSGYLVALGARGSSPRFRVVGGGARMVAHLWKASANEEMATYPLVGDASRQYPGAIGFHFDDPTTTIIHAWPDGPRDLSKVDLLFILAHELVESSVPGEIADPCSQMNAHFIIAGQSRLVPRYLDAHGACWPSDP